MKEFEGIIDAMEHIMSGGTVYYTDDAGDDILFKKEGNHI